MSRASALTCAHLTLTAVPSEQTERIHPSEEYKQLRHCSTRLDRSANAWSAIKSSRPSMTIRTTRRSNPFCDWSTISTSPVRSNTTWVGLWRTSCSLRRKRKRWKYPLHGFRVNCQSCFLCLASVSVIKLHRAYQDLSQAELPSHCSTTDTWISQACLPLSVIAVRHLS